MRKRIVISLVLFFLLTTIISKQKLLISKFNIKEIKIENNSIVKEKDIKKLLTPIYNESLLFLKMMVCKIHNDPNTMSLDNFVF